MKGHGGRIFVCLAGIVLGAGLLACADSGNGPGKEPLMRLTPDDSGREVTITAGQRFEVVLPEIPTSGYLWAVHRIDPEYLRLESEAYTEPEPGRPRVGTGREKVFAFEALKAGETVLELWLRRPWEEPDKHLKSFEIKLKIETGS
jgi:predicted secreted protein